MSNNELQVTVKNNLGIRYGERVVKVWKNDNNSQNQLQNPHLTIQPGNNVQVDPQGQWGPIQSIQLEAEDPTTTESIPISIDSPDNYQVLVTQEANEDRWNLVFEGQSLEKYPLTSKGDGEEKRVAVSVGEDESPLMQALMRRAIYSLIIGSSIAASWFVSPSVLKLSPVIWYVVPIASLVGGIFGGFWFRRRGKKAKKKG